MPWWNEIALFFQSIEEVLLALLLEHPYWVIAGIWGVIFLESSIFPFLPGDTLLFASGVALRTSPLSVHAAVWLFLAASALGVTLNYGIGRGLRDRIRTRGLWGIDRDQLRRAEHLMSLYGPRMLVLGRFLPGVRTAVPILAGTGRMSFGPFTLYNVLGGMPWVFLFTYAGYYLGGIPGVEAYLVPITLVLIALGLLPIFVRWVQVAWRNAHPSA